MQRVETVPLFPGPVWLVAAHACRDIAVNLTTCVALWSRSGVIGQWKMPHSLSDKG